MFITRADVLLREIAENRPQLHEDIMELAEAWDDHDRRGVVVDRVWPTIPKVAIDYAVAEPAAAAGDVAMIPGEFNWDDVGDFAAIGRLNPAEENCELTVMGEGARVFSENASGIVVSDTKRVIALIGIENVVIVDTPDALLVTTKEHAQEVKTAVERLRASGDTDVL